MRRTIVFLAGLATTLLVAAAASAAQPPSVTISVSRPVVVFGDSVTLSGKVSDHKSGESVNVLAEPFAETSFSAVTSTTSAAGGTWSRVVKPTIKTSYEAEWMGTTSSAVSVNVRPLITLSLVKLSTGTFSTKATAAHSFAGKFVLVQRLTSTGVATLNKVTLDASSSATFHVRLHHGNNRLRVVMPASQSAPGYLSGTSKVLTVSH